MNVSYLTQQIMEQYRIFSRILPIGDSRRIELINELIKQLKVELEDQYVEGEEYISESDCDDTEVFNIQEQQYI